MSEILVGCGKRHVVERGGGGFGINSEALVDYGFMPPAVPSLL